MYKRTIFLKKIGSNYQSTEEAIENLGLDINIIEFANLRRPLEVNPPLILFNKETQILRGTTYWNTLQELNDFYNTEYIDNLHQQLTEKNYTFEIKISEV